MKNDQCEAFSRCYLFIVPAKVEGKWKLGKGELTLRQSYQVLSGKLKTGDRVIPVSGRLKGDRITLHVGEAKYTGRVDGKSMEGTFESGGSAKKWSGVRVR